MDPVSHALLGAAAAQSLRRTPAPLAALAGVAGALLPDADVLIGSDTDPLLTLEYHRQFSHAFAAAPVGALVVALVLWLLTRRRHAFAALYVPALAGYVSAILLDACTSYGTQLLWPWSAERFSAGIVAVVDPVVTVALAIGVFLALRKGRARPARAALAVVALYLGFGWLQHERAERLVARAAEARGHALAMHAVKPTLGNLLLWRSVYLTGETFVVDAVRVGVLGASKLHPGGAVPRLVPVDLVPPLSPGSVQAADAARFAQVSEGYLARHPTLPHVIGDVRYSMLPDSTRPLWGIEIDPAREDAHVAFRTFRDLGEAERRRFLDLLLGREPAR